ncbi:MAG: ATP--guanido phosphotransferase [Gemmatimonadales bacterium]
MTDSVGGGGEDDLPWLAASGPWADLVVSTRVRLARNLVGVGFRGRNSEADREGVLEQVQAAAADAPSLAGATLHRLDPLPLEGRQWLQERQLVSRELAGLDPGGRATGGGAVLVAGAVAVMLNEEDHLRMQGLRSGFALDEALADAERADGELGARLSFAFHPEFGYLTACPTNVGTGLRASVLIHLPGLVLTREIAKVLQGLAQVGLTYRGLYGEGSAVLGNLFQLSNQTTLGKSESELLDHLGRLVRQVMECEIQARDVLRRDAAAVLDDQVWRAWGVLSHARAVTFDELVELLSGVRLGVSLGILPPLPLGTMNRLLVLAQSAHLARAAGTSLEDEALAVHRATLVRRLLADEGRAR